MVCLFIKGRFSRKANANSSSLKLLKLSEVIKINNHIAKRNKWVNKIHLGDALILLKQMPSHSVDCVVTSPPYWALRDYGAQGQLGLEPTFEKYVTKLCDIFDEVLRVLKREGTCFVNLGDTYAGSGKGAGCNGEKIESWNFDKKPYLKASVMAKSLCMIPFRFAIEMVARRWILRNIIVWRKPNATPASVKDRFTVDWEPLFFFTKNRRYYFKQQFEPIKGDSIKRYKYDLNSSYTPGFASPNEKRDRPQKWRLNPLGRNKRSVWEINTKAVKNAHYATFPEELCATPIKAGCPVNGIVLDPFMGAGTTALAALKLGRRFIGIELNENYILMANKRIKPWLEQRRLNSC